MGGLLHLVQRGGDLAGPRPPSPLLAVPNVTDHPWTARVPITVLLYDGPLLYGFNVAIKGLKSFSQQLKKRERRHLGGCPSNVRRRRPMLTRRSWVQMRPYIMIGRSATLGEVSVGGLFVGY